ncbi:hypothetical protein HQ544_02485 [Candidatus Falkowbacteria bacterium]|nr:hypothetical protein [Candidatus Falkowbacteria bacterium]
MLNNLVQQRSVVIMGSTKPDDPKTSVLKAFERGMPIDGLTGDPRSLIDKQFGGDEEAFLEAVRALV